jgi:hypothetical protein
MSANPPDNNSRPASPGPPGTSELAAAGREEGQQEAASLHGGDDGQSDDGQSCDGRLVDMLGGLIQYVISEEQHYVFAQEAKQRATRSAHAAQNNKNRGTYLLVLLLERLPPNATVAKGVEVEGRRYTVEMGRDASPEALANIQFKDEVSV